MKFVNIELTGEEQEEFGNRGIKSLYGRYEDRTKGIKPMYLTINEETDTWLTWCYFDHEAYEFVHEFLFMYRQCPMQLQATYECTKETGIHWKVTRLNIPNNLLSEKEVIKDLVVSAFLVYNATGWPEDCDPEFKTTCSFAEGV